VLICVQTLDVFSLAVYECNSKFSYCFVRVKNLVSQTQTSVQVLTVFRRRVRRTYWRLWWTHDRPQQKTEQRGEL